MMTEIITHRDYFSCAFALHSQYSGLCGNVVLFSSLEIRQGKDNSNNRSEDQTLMSVLFTYILCSQWDHSYSEALF